MSKENRMATIIENIAAISHYENGYAQVQYPLNYIMDTDLKTNNHKIDAFRVLTALHSCVMEEEKLLKATIKLLEDDMISYKQRSETTKTTTTRKVNHKANFEKFFSSSKITIGSDAIAFINGTWIIVNVRQINDGIYTVVDKYPEPGETPPELIVSEENIIYYGSSGFSRTPSTKDYILPAGTQVLALWPDTTEFYIATVMGRENVPDDLIAVQFADDPGVRLLPYHSVIPYRTPTF